MSRLYNGIVEVTIMALPIQIDNLIHGRTVESTRIEIKKRFCDINRKNYIVYAN